MAERLGLPLLGLLLSAAACASLAAARGGMDWPLPDPAAAPFQGERQQAVELRRGGGGASFLAALESRGGEVVMVGLSPLGQRLVRVDWKAAGVDVDVAPEVARYLDGAQALRDLAFTLWPPEALDKAFQGTEWNASYSDGRRVLRHGGSERLVVQREAGADGPVWVLRHPGQPGEIRVRDLAPEQP